MKSPTETTYAPWEEAFDHYNKRLFNKVLNQPLQRPVFTYSRRKSVMGIASKSRWIDPDGINKPIDEVSLNPEYFVQGNIVEVLQTLVHELCHLWQFSYGTPSIRSYHNKEWSNVMQRLGLMPSTTGKPGGRTTGQHMNDYVIEGGVFERETIRLLNSGFSIPLYDRYVKSKNIQDSKPVVATIEGSIKEECSLVAAASNYQSKLKNTKISGQLLTKKADSSKCKYCCPICNLSVWGKPDLKIGCLQCDVPLEPIGKAID